MFPVNCTFGVFYIEAGCVMSDGMFDILWITCSVLWLSICLLDHSGVVRTVVMPYLVSKYY